MNYPIWDLPAAGLLIAAVAVFHVFISHFAVGGGLFLVRFERLARKSGNRGLLDYVKTHSRVFVLLTLVLGAVTGVGIWFTIGLVHPSATSMLIQTFVWAWAIEWTFFATEIASAMVYYYGWSRLSPKVHATVGWIYFLSAWMSLFVINGILTFMLTPGEWTNNGSLTSALFNPTFWPSLVSRTLICAGLAGMYALVTVSFQKEGPTKLMISRRAVLEWILPAGILLPITLLWYLNSASVAGIPVTEIFGASSDGIFALLKAIFSAPVGSGYPNAQIGALCAILCSIGILILALIFGVNRRPSLNPYVSFSILIFGLAAFGGVEFAREDLRKPFVLGKVMFVNGVRLPVSATAEGVDHQLGGADRFEIGNIQNRGVISSALWNRDLPSNLGKPNIRTQISEGREVFRLLCTSCHTENGHMGIEPLVRGKNSAAIKLILDRLAVPVNQSLEDVTWSEPYFKIQTWRGRRMPPFAGNNQEKESLFLYLASFGGEHREGADHSPGQVVFEENCLICHAEEADWPMSGLVRKRNSSEMFDVVGKLPELNPIMPPFEGTDQQRKELAEFLAALDRDPE